MNIEFDPDKEALNLGKHKLSLTLAEDFDWDTAQIEEDRSEYYDEQHFKAVGIIGERLYTLIYCLRGEVLPPTVYVALTDKSKPATFTLVTDEEDRARRIGRPKLETPKLHINMRVDAPVVSHLRASGKGWQTRVNVLLREAVEQGRI